MQRIESHRYLGIDIHELPVDESEIRKCTMDAAKGFTQRIDQFSPIDESPVFPISGCRQTRLGELFLEIRTGVSSRDRQVQIAKQILDKDQLEILRLEIDPQHALHLRCFEEGLNRPISRFRAALNRCFGGIDDGG